MVAVPAGEYLLGGDGGYPADAEGPVRAVALDGFHLDATAVTVAKFATFAKATGYLTTAETEGWSYVFHLLVHHEAEVLDARVPETPWWFPVRGASWRHPGGPASQAVANHPVTHVSWFDAAAYASWAGKRLPTETEWEAAARGGLVGARYPWGDELTPRGRHRANIWQGRFPRLNTREDGFLGTAPVKTFPPNGYGLYQMAGNVWEWCADTWTAAGTADRGDSRVVRGGSYLCHESYCDRYRVAARTSNTPDSSSGNTGFRCAV
nr:formylglycine-generating enzyme family protein [Actinorhabdospora filicis]